MNHAKMIATVRYILSLLVRGEYDKLERVTKGIRVNASELREEVESNRQMLSMPPDNFFERVHNPEDNHFVVVEIEKSSPTQWHVIVDLWTDEEEFADISLEMIFTDSTEEMYEVEIDNLHML